MPLVEIVYDKKTDPAQVAKGAAFCSAISRFPLPVKSTPGFLVNRVLSGYMAKAMSMHLERGIPIEILDKAATSFGMPMGPGRTGGYRWSRCMHESCNHAGWRVD